MRSRADLFCLCCLLGLIPGGCAREAEPTFVVAEAVEELPELHQQTIEDGLRSIFGTPARPRISPQLLEDDQQPADEDAAEETVLELVDVDRLNQGAAIYANRCAGCHGVSGNGDGPAAAYLRPKPRDYRKGVYKFTSTPYGDRPARQDLIRTIRRGAKGTSMPAFPWMSNDDLEAVVDYVIFLSVRGRVEEMLISVAEDYDEDEPIDPEEFVYALDSEISRWEGAEHDIVRAISAEPEYDEESIKQGRTLYIKSSCFQCHGTDAEGQTEWLSPEFIAAQENAAPGERIQINYDAWDEPAPAADITARMLHGGRRPIDIYRRIYTGINGTPMPAFGQIFSEDPDAIWHLVHYVMHIVEGGDPTVGIQLEDVQDPTSEDSPSTDTSTKEAA